MTTKPNYAIMRIGKIRSRAVLDAVEWHNTRKGSARVVSGLGMPDDWSGRKGSYRDRADDILHELGATHDRGKILAVEVLVSTSPEWWVTATGEQKRQWWEAQYAYAKHTFGPGLVAFTPHLDESTPHAQFVGLPVYYATKKKRGAKPKDPEKLRKRLEEEAKADKVWRLSHDAVFGGGPRGLARHQTKYHKFVSHLGLERGRDTVDQGVKHIPLKHYEKLLTQMEKDLSQKASRLAEQQEVLDHYDRELGEKNSELKEFEKSLDRDELALFAKQEELRLREEKISCTEKRLAEDRAALAQSEKDIKVRLVAIDNRKAELSKIGYGQTVRNAELSLEKDRLAAREAALTKREGTLTAREKNTERREISVRDAQTVNREEAARLAASEAANQTLISQISVFTGVLTGRLSMKWGVDKQPANAAGDVKPGDVAAFSSKWPPVLVVALRHAEAMVSSRKRLADKMRSMLRSLRKRRRTVDAAEIAMKEKQAYADLRTRELQDLSARADMKLEAANAAQENARAAEQKAAADRRAADERIAAANAVEYNNRKKHEELKDLEGAVSANKNELSTVRAEITRVQSELNALQLDRTNLEGELAAVLAQKKSQQSELSALTVKRKRLKEDNARLDRQRSHLEAEKKAWNRSMEIWQRAAVSQTAIEMTEQGEILRINASTPGSAARIVVAEIDPAIVALVRQKQALIEKMDATERLAAKLDRRYEYLQKRFPNQGKALQAAREDGRSIVNQAWENIGRESPRM